MSKDLALCVPAVAPGDAHDLSVGQRELLNAVQTSSHVPEIIRLSRLPEGIALKELEALLHGGWVVPFNPTLSGRPAVDPLPVSAGMMPSTVKGFVSPDDLGVRTQRTFNAPGLTSQSEQELDAALERLTEMTSKPGDTASVFAPSVAPKTPQVNASGRSLMPTDAELPLEAQPAPPKVEVRASIKATPIRTVAIGAIKPLPARATVSTAANQDQNHDKGSAAQAPAPQTRESNAGSQPPVAKASEPPPFGYDSPSKGRISSPPAPWNEGERRSSNPGERRSPIPLPADLANDRRSPLPRVNIDKKPPHAQTNGAGERPSAPPFNPQATTRQSAPPPAAGASLEASSGDSSDVVFLLGPKSAPPLSPFPPAPSGEFTPDLHLSGLLRPQERPISDIEGLRRTSRPPPRVSEVQSLGLPPEVQVQTQAASAQLPVGQQFVPGGVAGRPAMNPRSAQSGEFVPGEPLPFIRITRRPSPALGTTIPERHSASTIRDDGRGSPSPVPAAQGAAVGGTPRRMSGATLVGGLQAQGSASVYESTDAFTAPPTDAGDGANDASDDGSSQTPVVRAGSPQPRLNKASGRTLLGGSYIGSESGDSSQTTPALEAVDRGARGAKVVGVSRMVVVGERAGNPQTSATRTPLNVAPFGAGLPGGATLLGVPAPSAEELAGYALPGHAAANDADTEEPAGDDQDEQLGHFEVIELLAKGGNGVVYRVHDPHAPSGEYLALKVLRQEHHKNPHAVAALTREATLMEQLSHPGLVKFHDFGHEGSEPFLLMECIDGLSMSELLHHPVPLPFDVGLIIIQDALEVLDYVHRQRIGNEPPGIIHCDVSPQNLLVGSDGRARLIDFGISRTPGVPIGDGLVRCKPRYASPELLAGREVDATTDVFAVGAVLFQVLSKMPAFSGDPARRKRESLVPNPSKLNSRAPSRFDPICHRALDPDPKERYSSAGEMLAALNEAIVHSDIVLRRERVKDWVERVQQSRGGELQLQPEELQEMMAGRYRRTTQSLPRKAVHQGSDPAPASSETYHELPSRPVSDPPDSQLGAAHAAHETEEGQDGAPSARTKFIVLGIAFGLACSIALFAVVKPDLFRSIFFFKGGSPPPAATLPLPSATQSEPRAPSATATAAEPSLPPPTNAVPSLEASPPAAPTVVAAPSAGPPKLDDARGSAGVRAPEPKAGAAPPNKGQANVPEAPPAGPPAPPDGVTQAVPEDALTKLAAPDAPAPVKTTAPPAGPPPVSESPRTSGSVSAAP